MPHDSTPPSLEILGEARRFCCPGCLAVCRTIVDAGLDDYYRYREGESATATDAAVPEFLQKLEIYDRDDIQSGFVRSSGGWKEASLLLEDIRCPACLWLNERHLRTQPGILDVHIDGATQRMRVRWDPQQTRLSRILEAIAAIGYIAHPYDATRSEHLHKARQRRSVERLLFAGILGMMVMQISIATYIMGAPEEAGVLPLWVVIGRWTGLSVTFLLLAYSGQDFFVGAWNDLRNRRLGMDVPVVLGMVSAWLASLHATLLQQGEVYFDSIAMFIFFLLLARHLETRARTLAADHLDRLARAVPQLARRQGPDQGWQEVPVMEVEVGDRVRILPGETVPVDGVLIDGRSEFDESLLTGESVPVSRGPGEAITAGSVNGEQPVLVRVVAVGEATTISEIRRMVDSGLEQRPRAAMVADRVARWFVVAILLIAGATASGWYLLGSSEWLANTIAVLIVTCPCALALATPVALTVANGRFVDHGILPLRMAALEGLAKVDLAAFDKTGTLTRGEPLLVEVVAAAGVDEATVLRQAALLASGSEHGLSRALRTAAGGVLGECPERLENLPGLGVEADIDGQVWRLGRPAFVLEMAQAEPRLQQELARLRHAGSSLVLLSRGRELLALFALDDMPREGLETLVPDLQRLGIADTALLSGDTEESVARVARRLNIGLYHARQSPQAKLARVRDWQRQGRRVLMVGDGINDAPTLAAADVSISLADATDMANAGSDFLLLNNDPAVIPEAIRLSRRTLRNIRQNLLWAAGYNLCAVPLAALGWIPPWGAAIGMSASSLLVVVNALRLRR